MTADARTLTILTAMLLSLAAPVRAQLGGPLSAPTGTSLPPEATIRAGTVSLYPSVEVRIVGVDSNVFNEAVDPRDDFSAEMNPQLVGAWRVGPALLVGAGQANLSYFHTYKEAQAGNGLVSGRFELVSTRFRPFAAAGYLRSRERTGYEIDERALRVEDAVSAGADFEVTAVTWLTGWVQRSRLAYAEGEEFLGIEIGDQLNRTSELAAAGVKFSLTPLTTLVVAAEVERDRFESSPVRDADRFRVVPALEFGSGAIVNGRVALGYGEFRPIRSDLPPYKGFVAAAATRFTLLGMTTFDVTADRDVQHSLDTLAPFYLNVGGRVTVSQRVGGPFDIIGSGDWHRLRYQSLGGSSLDGRTETTNTLGGGVGVRFNIDFRLAVTYEYTKRDVSEPDFRQYDRRRLLGILSYGL